MENKKYKISNKYIKGVNIEGYTISNEQGNSKFVKADDVIKLALNDKLSNARAVLNTETSSYILDIDGGNKALDTITKLNSITLSLQCRIMDTENKCIGYKAKDESGKSYRLTIQNTWELALGQAIIGVEAVIISGVKVLRSKDGFSLAELPKINN